MHISCLHSKKWKLAPFTSTHIITDIYIYFILVYINFSFKGLHSSLVGDPDRRNSAETRDRGEQQLRWQLRNQREQTELHW